MQFLPQLLVFIQTYLPELKPSVMKNSPLTYPRRIKKIWILPFFMAFLIFILLSSCKKSEIFVSQLSLRFENRSDLSVDSLKIRSSYHYDSIKFSLIRPGDLTEFKDFHDIYIDPLFKIYSGDSLIICRWKCPKYVIDPAGIKYTLLPNGYYTFCILNPDTLSEGLHIGLTDFRISF